MARAPMPDLYLNKDVYFCVTEGQGVFLDLRQDSYVSVPVTADRAPGSGPLTEAELLQAFEQHRADLVAENLLSDTPANRVGFFAYRSIPRPLTNIFHPEDDRAFGEKRAAGQGVRLGAIDIVDFLLASQRASRLLKKQHIRRIVEDVRSRKAASADKAIDVDRLRLATGTFRKLRPWYPRPYLCLWDALALVEFLARRKMFPTWVFGVQAQPFGAHCWTQIDDLLLNEGTEYAGQFTPIMAV